MTRGIRDLKVTCETCLDRKHIHRIRGGIRWPEACPDCSGGAW